MFQVALNGHWGRWAAWSACSTTCGKGYQTRSRMCDDPPPKFKGDICEGVLVEVQMCKGNRPKCKSSNKGKGTSKFSFPLGFVTRALSSPKIWPLLKSTPFKELTRNTELMPHESKANDQDSQVLFLILLKVVFAWVWKEVRICFALASLRYAIG